MTGIQRRFKEFPLSTAITVLSVMLMIVVVTFVVYVKQHERDPIADCRGKAGAALATAQTDNAIAFNNLVIVLAGPDGRNEVPPYDAEIKALQATGRELVEAAKVRADFEMHPTGNC